MKPVFSSHFLKSIPLLGSNLLLTTVNENMKGNQCPSGRNRKPVWLPVATLLHFYGNRCCLSAGARLHDEADAPSQWEHRECRWCGRSAGAGWGGVPTTALPPTYCYAQQYLPTPHTVSAGKNWYNSENSCR